MKRRDFIALSAMAGAAMAAPSIVHGASWPTKGITVKAKGPFVDVPIQDWLVQGKKVISARSRKNIVVLNSHKRSSGRALATSNRMDGFGHGHGLGQYGKYLYIGAGQRGTQGVRLFKMDKDGAVYSHHFYRISSTGYGTTFPSVGKDMIAIRTFFPTTKMRLRIYKNDEFFGDPTALPHTVNRKKLEPLFDWGFAGGPYLQGMCWDGDQILTLSGRSGFKRKKLLRRYNIQGELLEKFEINTGINWAASQSSRYWELEGMHFVDGKLHVGVVAGRVGLVKIHRQFKIMPVQFG